MATLRSENTGEAIIVNKKRRTSRVCCVVNCRNSEVRNPELIFYRFPGQPWEADRKKKWIAAVRRQTIDKKPWVPTNNSRICSSHFVGGEKSNDPRKEQYNPTLFPSIYKRKELSTTRKKRLEARNIKKVEAQTVNNVDVDRDLVLHMDNNDNQPAELCGIEVGTQTDPNLNDNYKGGQTQGQTIQLFCSNSKNEVSTQTVININSCIEKHSQRVILEPSPYKSVETNTVAVGEDCDLPLGFVGFQSITSDEIMKQLGGINLFIFQMLLRFIVPNNDGQPSYFKKVGRENRLLLFLMKMKLGLSFTVLGCLFQVSRVTASSIFFAVLSTLKANTKTWVFWPSKEAVKHTMPPSFINYPNTRAIIDCTELRCDTPPTVEQRVLMYSSYKGCFTVKFLVAISPSGLITFVSKGYGGRATDGFITNDSGFLNLLEPGDEVMADKGFPQIKTELLQRQCTLVMPPFAFNPQFTREEVLEGYSIASVRIHVERAIQRIKIFKILDHINVELLEHIDDIMLMACVLANNKEPLIAKK